MTVTKWLTLALIVIVVILVSGLLFQSSKIDRDLSELQNQVAYQSHTLDSVNSNLAKNLDETTQATLHLKHIFGVNPILKPGIPGSWDNRHIEMGSVLFDNENYYLYYHALGSLGGGSYRIGVAIAPTPFGPWTRFENNPILWSGTQGEWDDYQVACPKVIRIGDTYYMFYSGARQGDYPRWGIGIATATSPLGPWRKYNTNPILDDFGYIGSIININGTFFLYATYPIEPTTDQGPVALATAESVFGPWKKFDGNPIIPIGSIGSWASLGFSEPGALYQDGLVLMFLGGSRYLNTVNPGNNPRESSIGYGYSPDGYRFILSRYNPVIPAGSVGARYLGEAFAWAEPPLFLIYSTFLNPKDDKEYIAVNALSMSDAFKSYLPLLTKDVLEPGASTNLGECLPLFVLQAARLAITIEVTYDTAIAGASAHIYTSYDGTNWDTEELKDLSGSSILGEIPFKAGETVRVTRYIPSNARFLKVVVKNNDMTRPVHNVRVFATLSN